jgi:holo-[acyl-carrier protein] synthase
MRRYSLVLGIGTDIIEIERIRQAVEKGGRRFLERIYTSAEISCCSARRDPFPCYAARFAAKEAVLKALGTGLTGCRWTDVEVYNAAGGKPRVRLSGRAALLAGDLGVGSVLLSLSHDRGRALAFAVALGRESEYAGSNCSGNERDGSRGNK